MAWYWWILIGVVIGAVAAYLLVWLTVLTAYKGPK